MWRTMQLLPVLRLTSEEEASKGTYASNRQEKSTCAIGNGIIVKDNSKTYIIPNQL